MKIKEDFEKWEETAECENNRCSMSHLVSTYTTPNGSFITEHNRYSSILKPVEEYFYISLNYLPNKEIANEVKKYNGKEIVHPYSEEMMTPVFYSLEDAWLFIMNTKELILEKVKEKQNGYK